MARPSLERSVRIALFWHERGTDRCRYLCLELILARMSAASSGWMRQALSLCAGAFDVRASWISSAGCRPASWRWKPAVARITSVGCSGPAGHTIRLMSPEYVRPYVKANKNDDRDAEAIAEAATRPTMRFVPVKSEAQSDIQALHRARSRLVAERTALINHLRALLLERGIVVAQGRRKLEDALTVFADEEDPRLSPRMRLLVEDLRTEWRSLDERIAAFDAEFVRMAREDEAARRLATIPGIGVINATALTAAVGDARSFGRGRDLAAWLGLTPRQATTGGKPRLLGIIQARQPLPAGKPDPWRPRGPAAHHGPGHAAGPVGCVVCRNERTRTSSWWRWPPSSRASSGRCCARSAASIRRSRRHRKRRSSAAEPMVATICGW